MDECKYQIEVMGQASADEVLERNPMLVQDQRDIIATWTFNAQGA